MNNNIMITASGNVTNEPIYFAKTEEKPAYASFRFAATPSYYSKAKSEWINGTTSWFEVKSYGALATHISDSINKGDPVIITGTMRTQVFEKQDGGDGYSNQIIATSVGHNLLMGNSSFTRGKASDADLADSIPEETEIIDSEK